MSCCVCWLGFSPTCFESSCAVLCGMCACLLPGTACLTWSGVVHPAACSHCWRQQSGRTSTAGVPAGGMEGGRDSIKQLGRAKHTV